MSYTSGFFDAVDLGGGDYDREYSAAVFAHYFSLLVKNGVFPDPSTGMQVKASSSPDMHVSVQPGSGWVNGYYITVPENGPEALTVPTANPSLSRIDSVIMGLNYVEREIQLYIKSGAVSASPSAVSLQRDNDLYEMELAQITVAAGVASISQSNITDMRQNTSRCGIVKGTIDQIDTTDLFAQYNDAFQTWFADIQAQLSGDVATNLQNQINTLKTGKVNVSDKASTAQAQAGTDDTKWMTPSLVKAFYTALKASQSEVTTATNGDKWVSPLTLGQRISPILQNILKVTNLELLVEYTTAGSRTANIPADADIVYAVIIGAGGGGAGGKIGHYIQSEGGFGGQGGNLRLVGPIKASSVTNKNIVVGAGGTGGAGEIYAGRNSSSNKAAIKGNNGGSSSAFGVSVSGGAGGEVSSSNASSAQPAEVAGGLGSTSHNTAGGAGVLVDTISCKTSSAGGGCGGGAGTAGGSGGTSNRGSGGAGGKGAASQSEGQSGSNGAAGGLTCGGGGGGAGSTSYESGIRTTGGTGGTGGAGYVAIYVIRKGA